MTDLAFAARTRDGHAGHRRGLCRPRLARRGGQGVANRAGRRLAIARESRDGDGLLGHAPRGSSLRRARALRQRGVVDLAGARGRCRRRARRRGVRRRRRHQPRVVGMRRARRDDRTRHRHGERLRRGARRRDRPLRGALLLRRRRLPRAPRPVRARADARGHGRCHHGELFDGEGRSPRRHGATRRDEASGASRLPRDRRRARAHRMLRPAPGSACRSGSARAPLFAVLALVAIVGNVSAIRRLRAVAEEVRKPTPAWAKTSNGAKAIARDTHAAAGDALR